MSFIQITGGNEVKEPTLAPEGEYQLTIVDKEIKESKNSPGRDVIHLRIAFTDYDEYADFMHWIALPSKKVDIDGADTPEKGQEKFAQMILSLKRNLHLMNVKFDDGFDDDDLLGATFIGAVTQEINEDSDDQRPNQRLKVPRLPYEE